MNGRFLPSRWVTLYKIMRMVPILMAGSEIVSLSYPFDPCVFAGDWLQGPYIYQLYHSYGFREGEIAVLFLVGYLSSSTFGTFTGPMADKYGRRKMARVFGILYSVVCCMKLVQNFWVLLAGRVIGRYLQTQEIFLLKMGSAKNL